MPNIELDQIDRNILKIMQENNQTPHRLIADSVGLSAPAVTRRLKRLRSDHIIREDVSVLDSAALGRPLILIVEVVANSEQTAELDTMRNAFNRCPQIQHCYYVTGEADFILIFSISDMAEYEKLTRRLFLDCENVKRFTTFVSMETVKASEKIIVN
jgi:Lrp/AsnC family leucine-responsive transcriptional regulator